jgi:hypothetical protein
LSADELGFQDSGGEIKTVDRKLNTLKIKIIMSREVTGVRRNARNFSRSYN